MREILFRAKRNDNGEWVEGYYVKTRLGTDTEPSKAVVLVNFKTAGNKTVLNNGDGFEYYPKPSVSLLDSMTKTVKRFGSMI